MFVRCSILFFIQLIVSGVSLGQSVLMLRSDVSVQCSISRLGNAVLMKDDYIADVKLNDAYRAIDIPNAGYYFVNVQDASTGICLENKDTLWVDWVGKEDRAIIRKGQSRELNIEMASVDSICDIRLLELLKYATIRRAKEVKYFSDTLRKRYESHRFEQLKNYVFYRTAYVEIVAESDARANLMRKYFERAAEPLNTAWVESFRNLYSGFLLQKLNGRNGAKLDHALRGKLWQPIWSEFRNDSLAMHPEVREFAFLYGINQLRSQNNYSAISFEWMLDSLALQTVYPQVKQIAASVKADWQKYDKGKDVPDFSFKLLNGKDMRFSELKGTPVYLCYYASFSQATYRELAMLQAFKQRFKNEIEFLIVVKTGEKSGVLKALDSIKSTMLVTDLASCSDAFKQIPETLQANSYFLINRNGKYYKAPAEGPETGIEDSFLGLVKD